MQDNMCNHCMCPVAFFGVQSKYTYTTDLSQNDGKWSARYVQGMPSQALFRYSINLGITGVIRKGHQVIICDATWHQNSSVWHVHRHDVQTCYALAGKIQRCFYIHARVEDEMDRDPWPMLHGFGKCKFEANWWHHQPQTLEKKYSLRLEAGEPFQTSLHVVVGYNKKAFAYRSDWKVW